MIKYASHAVTFAEVPDEVCLTIQVTNCPYRCKGCHSSYLQQDIGVDLEKDLPDLLEQYKGRVTCVCFMGSGMDWVALARCIDMAHAYGFRVALYTGNDFDSRMKDWLSSGILRNGVPEYIKTGTYVEPCGGLDNPNTNQRMWRIRNDFTYENITSRFWKTRIEDMI